MHATFSTLLFDRTNSDKKAPVPRRLCNIRDRSALVIRALDQRLGFFEVAGVFEMQLGRAAPPMPGVGHVAGKAVLELHRRHVERQIAHQLFTVRDDGRNVFDLFERRVQLKMRFRNVVAQAQNIIADVRIQQIDRALCALQLFVERLVLPRSPRCFRIG